MKTESTSFIHIIYFIMKYKVPVYDSENPNPQCLEQKENYSDLYYSIKKEHNLRK